MDDRQVINKIAQIAVMILAVLAILHIAFYHPPLPPLDFDPPEDRIAYLTQKHLYDTVQFWLYVLVGIASLVYKVTKPPSPKETPPQREKIIITRRRR